MLNTVMATILSVLLIGFAAVGAFADDDRYVEFRGRKIDLKPYFEGFPYKNITPIYEAGRVFYFEEGKTRVLKEARLRGDIDLARGNAISGVDFSKRNVWGMRFNPRDKHLYWIGDEKNDEIINLYRLNIRSQKIEQLTDVPYIFGWRWDRDHKRIAYVSRAGHREERLGQIKLLELDTGRDVVMYEDDPSMRLTWTSPAWQEYGRGVVVTVLKDADRKYGNVAYFDFQKRELKVLTDTSRPRNWPSPLHWWIDADKFVYFSNEDGYENAYRYNIDSGMSVQLTRYQRDIGEAEMIGFNGRRYIFAVLKSPIVNDLVVIDPISGKTLDSLQIDVNIEILDQKNNRLLVAATSATEKYRIDEIKIDLKRIAIGSKLRLPDELKTQIVHSTVEKIDYPTFDTDPNTGKTRMLHAFLYRPTNPLPADQQMVMIQSFYGGRNDFSTRNQILCEAGIYVLSPSPRGSAGFGREFSALNDKDLGGNEIIDVIYAAKWAEKNLGVPPERIGVFGGSHGGYATMRCLTFPGEINGNKADFDWGFGISHAGFSDIVHFYENCNVPDWVILEAGDPKTEADKLRDRSPLYHADKGRGKLLLTHGTNDSRVPIEGSRWMADSLRVYGKDVTLIEFEDQGHGIKGLENQIRFYKIWFEFLETVGTDGRASN